MCKLAFDIHSLPGYTFNNTPLPARVVFSETGEIIWEKGYIPDAGDIHDLEIRAAEQMLNPNDIEFCN